METKSFKEWVSLGYSIHKGEKAVKFVNSEPYFLSLQTYKKGNSATYRSTRFKVNKRENYENSANSTQEF